MNEIESALSLCTQYIRIYVCMLYVVRVYVHTYILKSACVAIKMLDLNYCFESSQKRETYNRTGKSELRTGGEGVVGMGTSHNLVSVWVLSRCKNNVIPVLES